MAAAERDVLRRAVAAERDCTRILEKMRAYPVEVKRRFAHVVDLVVAAESSGEGGAPAHGLNQYEVAAVAEETREHRSRERAFVQQRLLRERESIGRDERRRLLEEQRAAMLTEAERLKRLQAELDDVLERESRAEVERLLQPVLDQEREDHMRLVQFALSSLLERQRVADMEEQAFRTMLAEEEARVLRLERWRSEVKQAPAVAAVSRLRRAELPAEIVARQRQSPGETPQPDFVALLRSRTDADTGTGRSPRTPRSAPPARQRRREASPGSGYGASSGYAGSGSLRRSALRTGSARRARRRRSAEVVSAVSPPRRLQLYLTVDLPSGERDTIAVRVLLHGAQPPTQVYDGDEPRALADAFCGRHGLGDLAVPALTQRIRDSLRYVQRAAV